MFVTILLILTLAILGSLLTVLLMAKPAQAALPPQSADELAERAIFILTGKVNNVTVQEIEATMGSDYQYHGVFKVDTVEKSGITVEKARSIGIQLPATMPQPATEIDIYYWQTKQRPLEWSGPTGQIAQIPSDAQVRLFLTIKNGRFELLQPLGWEKV